MGPVFPLSYIIPLSGIGVNVPDFKSVIGFIILIVLLICSALMSGSEVAYFSFRPEDIENLKMNKDKQSKTILKLYNNPEKLLSTVLVANNTVNIAIVLLAAFLSSRIFDFSSEPVLGFIINVVVITFLLLFFGEVMPKVYASRNHITLALFMAYPLTLLGKSLSACYLFADILLQIRKKKNRNPEVEHQYG